MLTIREMPGHSWPGRLSQLARALICAAIAVVVLASCGARPGPSAQGAAAPGASAPVATLPAFATASVTLPQGYAPIPALVGDPSGAGAWFWDLTSSQIDVFREDAQGNLTSWPVLTGSAYIAPQAQSGFAVTASGAAWLGINTTLAELNTQTGAVRTWQIPAPEDSPAAEAYQPPDLAGTHAVRALALGPGGEVAIVLTSASSVEIFDPSAGTFTQVAMSSQSDEPISAAFSADGSLAVGFADLVAGQADGAFITSPNGSALTATVSDSSEVTAVMSNSFVFGSVAPDAVGPDGTVTSVITPAVQLDPNPAPEPIATLPNGNLAAITTTGIVEFPESASTVAAATAGTTILSPAQVPCGPAIARPALPSADSPSPAAVPSDGMCQAPPMKLVATDGVGNIWVVSPNQLETVARLAP